MSKRRTILVAVVGLLVAGMFMAVATMAPFKPAAQGMSAGSPEEKRWQAVAPGRVEPCSGQIKVAPAVTGLVDKVLVKANDKVFAGEPLIRLSDDELRARLAAARPSPVRRAPVPPAAHGLRASHRRLLAYPRDSTSIGRAEREGRWHRRGGLGQCIPRV